MDINSKLDEIQDQMARKLGELKKESEILNNKQETAQSFSSFKKERLNSPETGFHFQDDQRQTSVPHMAKFANQDSEVKQPYLSENFDKRNSLKQFSSMKVEQDQDFKTEVLEHDSQEDLDEGISKDQEDYSQLYLDYVNKANELTSNESILKGLVDENKELKSIVLSREASIKLNQDEIDSRFENQETDQKFWDNQVVSHEDDDDSELEQRDNEFGNLYEDYMYTKNLLASQENLIRDQQDQINTLQLRAQKAESRLGEFDKQGVSIDYQLDRIEKDQSRNHSSVDVKQLSNTIASIKHNAAINQLIDNLSSEIVANQQKVKDQVHSAFQESDIKMLGDNMTDNSLQPSTAIDQDQGQGLIVETQSDDNYDDDNYKGDFENLQDEQLKNNNELASKNNYIKELTVKMEFMQGKLRKQDGQLKDFEKSGISVDQFIQNAIQKNNQDEDVDLKEVEKKLKNATKESMLQGGLKNLVDDLTPKMKTVTKLQDSSVSNPSEITKFTYNKSIDNSSSVPQSKNQDWKDNMKNKMIIKELELKLSKTEEMMNEYKKNYLELLEN